VNHEENEVEEPEEPKLEEAIDIFKKYFKISFETAGIEWTEKNDKEIRFAVLELVNTPLYDIRQLLLEEPCDCDDEDCNCNEIK
jgi:hypothetical protein